MNEERGQKSRVILKVRVCTPGLVLNVTGIENCTSFVVPGTRPNVALACAGAASIYSRRPR